MNKGTERILIIGAVILGVYFLVKSLSNAANTVANKLPNFDLSSAFGDTVSTVVTTGESVASGILSAVYDLATGNVVAQAVSGLSDAVSNSASNVFRDLGDGDNNSN